MCTTLTVSLHRTWYSCVSPCFSRNNIEFEFSHSFFLSVLPSRCKFQSSTARHVHDRRDPPTLGRHLLTLQCAFSTKSPVHWHTHTQIISGRFFSKKKTFITNTLNIIPFYKMMSAATTIQTTKSKFAEKLAHQIQMHAADGLTSFALRTNHRASQIKLC